jgi:hypothetical protein
MGRSKVSVVVDGKKQCRSCFGFFPLEQFVRQKKCADGRRHLCKACHNLSVYRYRKTGSTKLNAFSGYNDDMVVRLHNELKQELKRREIKL